MLECGQQSFSILTGCFPDSMYLSTPRGRFHQRSTYNFYACGAQKRKMTMLTWLSFFAHSGSTCVKAVRIHRSIWNKLKWNLWKVKIFLLKILKLFCIFVSLAACEHTLSLSHTHKNTHISTYTTHTDNTHSSTRTQAHTETHTLISHTHTLSHIYTYLHTFTFKFWSHVWLNGVSFQGHLFIFLLSRVFSLITVDSLNNIIMYPLSSNIWPLW